MSRITGNKPPRTTTKKDTATAARSNKRAATAKKAQAPKVEQGKARPARQVFTDVSPYSNNVGNPVGSSESGPGNTSGGRSAMPYVYEPSGSESGGH